MHVLIKQIKTNVIVFVLLVLMGCDKHIVVEQTSLVQSPNILMVLIDDLGYTDIGAYGGNVSTTNIDSLATEGIRFSNAHVYPSCAPTRASFITGKDPHQVGFGSQNGVTPPGVSTTTKGYRGSLEGEYIGLASLLKRGGYDTYQVGKWHLGHQANQAPKALGFDHYFTLLDGAASHYADQLGVGLAISPSGKATYMSSDKTANKLPDNFYSTQAYTQWLIDNLERRNGSDKPFFAYLAYTAVHDPLHAPEVLLEKYYQLFDGDYKQLKQERISALIAQGLLPSNGLTVRWLDTTPDVETLSPTEIDDQRHRMAAYAAMLEYVDNELGRLFSFLKATGMYDDTLIVVMSDNGAATVPKTFYARNTQQQAWQDKAYPLSDYRSYGKPGSFPTLGTYNAQAVAGPYFGFKTNLHEGGTRVPMIIKVPQVNRGLIQGSFVHISDLYQTFADVAKVSTADQTHLLGCSLVPLFSGDTSSCPQEFGMEYMGWRSYLAGKWKLIFMSKSFGGTGRYALYNLDVDPGETNDLAAVHPGIVTELSKKWLAYAEKQQVVVVPMTKVNTFFDRISSKFLGVIYGI